MIFAILVIALLTMSAVNATDNINNDTVDDVIICESHNDGLQAKSNDIEDVSKDNINKNSVKDNSIEASNSKTNNANTKPLKSIKDSNTVSYTVINDNELTVNDYDDLCRAVEYFNSDKRVGIITLEGNTLYSVSTLKNITIDSSITINGNGRTIQGFRSSDYIDPGSSPSITNLIHILEGNTVNIFNLTFNDNSPTQFGIINNEGNLTLKNIKFINSSGYNAIAIYNWGNLKLNDSIFENLHYVGVNSYHQGGAIHIVDGIVNITNCNFTNCSTIRYGGAISINYPDSWEQGNPSVLINKSIFKDNSASNGGAIRISVTSNVNITDCEFINNSANYGGAIILDGSSVYPASNITISSSLFSDNRATEGGAFFIQEHSNTVIEGNTFNNNHATNRGGAFFIQEHGNPVIDGNNFNDNYADSNSGTFRVINSEITLTNNNICGDHAKQVDFLWSSHSSTIKSENNTMSEFHSTSSLILLYNYGSVFNSTNDTIKNCFNDVIIYNDEGSELYLQNGTIVNNWANDAVIFNNGLASLYYNNISNNYVRNVEYYVIYNEESSTLNMGHNLFVNNTDNTRDMLLNNDTGRTFNVEPNNIYIDNYLEDYWNVTTDFVDVISNEEKRIHVINLRNVYKNVIVNGTIICYLKGSTEVFDTFDVENGEALVTLTESPSLGLGEHIFELEYQSLSKHYQNLMGGELRIELKINLKAEPVNVTKIWRDDDSSNWQEITINLYKNDAFNQTALLNDANDWKYSFNDLSKFDDEGNLIIYTIDEPTVPEGYIKTITNNTRYNFTVTNIKAINIDVTKVWDDNDNQDGIRPLSVSVNLTADGVVVGNVVLNEGNFWKHTFKDLPKYDNNNLIIYNFTEDSIIGYSLTVTNETYNYNLLNTHVPENVTVNVTKVWDDNGDNDGLRPANVIVHLFNKDTNEELSHFVLNESNNWKHSFTDLPKFNNGALINYTITEDAINNYVTSISNKTYKFTVTNTHVPERVTVNVTKVWADNNKIVLRPSSVTVIVKNKGTEVKRHNLVASEGWTYSFTDLPKFDKGNLITYTIDELNVPEGFVKSITNNTPYNFTVTNKALSKAKINYVVINDIEGKVAIEIKVYDENDDEIPNSKLTITIDDETTSTTIKTNRIYKNTTLTAGEHTINVKYLGTDVYGETTGVIHFTVVTDPNTLKTNITELENKIKELDTLQTNITTLKEAIEKLNGQITILNNTINILNSTIQNQNVTKLNQTIQELQQQVNNLINKNLTQLKINISDLENKIKDLEELQTDVINLENKIKELEVLQADIINLENKIRELEALQTNITTLNETIQNLNAEITMLNNTINILNSTMQNQNLTNNITNLQQQIAELKNNTKDKCITPLFIQNNFFIIKINDSNQQNSAPVNPSLTPTTTTKTNLTLKTVKKLSKRAKKLKLKATLKINGKKVKGKKVTFIFRGRKFIKKTNKKGVAKLIIKKAKLKKLLKKTKVGKKVVVKVKYAKTLRKKYIKIKK